MAKKRKLTGKLKKDKVDNMLRIQMQGIFILSSSINFILLTAMTSATKKVRAFTRNK